VLEGNICIKYIWRKQEQTLALSRPETVSLLRREALSSPEIMSVIGRDTGTSNLFT
jgi:hypothetical protein